MAVSRLLQNPLGEVAPEGANGDIVRSATAQHDLLDIRRGPQASEVKWLFALDLGAGEGAGATRRGRVIG